MRASLLKILKCPQCGTSGHFSVSTDFVDSKEIREGKVRCFSCNALYPIQRGVLDLLSGSDVRKEVTREVNGWEKEYAGWFDLSGEKSNFWLVEPDNKETEGISSDED